MREFGEDYAKQKDVLLCLFSSVAGFLSFSVTSMRSVVTYLFDLPTERTEKS